MWPTTEAGAKRVRAEAAKFLLEQIPNKEGYNVIQYATSVGSLKFIRHTFNFENIYKNVEGKQIKFDVTNLSPETSSEDRNHSVYSSSAFCFENKSKVEPTVLTKEKSALGELRQKLGLKKLDKEAKKKNDESCLKIIIDMDDTDLATQLLDSSPIKYLILGYWTVYRFLYVIALIVHIIFMILQSFVPVRDIRQVWRNSTSTDYVPDPDYGFLLIWPTLLAVFYMVNLVILIRSFCGHVEDEDGQVQKKTSNAKEADTPNQPTITRRAERNMAEKTPSWLTALSRFMTSPRGVWECIDFLSDTCSPKTFHFQLIMYLVRLPFDFLYNLIQGMISHFEITLGMTYFVLVSWWFSLYMEAERDQVYILALALIIGWLQTINFARGFESVNVFIIMLKYIIIQDITTLLVIYVFFLLGFASAFQVLFQISGSIAESYPSVWHFIFGTFNLMIGIDEVIDRDLGDEYEDNKGDSIFLRCIAAIYIIFATVILLNILIAKMSDTYTEVRMRESTHWRVDSVRQAIAFEKRIPKTVAQSFRDMRRRRSEFPIFRDPNTSRLFLAIPVSKVDIKLSDVKSKSYHHITNIETKLQKLEEQLKANAK